MTITPPAYPACGQGCVVPVVKKAGYLLAPAEGLLHTHSVKSRIMFIEHKGGDLTGSARIGRVTFSKTMKRVYYGEQVFQRNEQPGFKSNHYDVVTGDDYWISGPKKAGGDRLYGERVPVEIDADVRVEYWTEVRNQPDRVTETDASK